MYCSILCCYLCTFGKMRSAYYFNGSFNNFKIFCIFCKYAKVILGWLQIQQWIVMQWFLSCTFSARWCRCAALKLSVSFDSQQWHPFGGNCLWKALIDWLKDVMKMLHTLDMTAPCHGKTNPSVVLFTVCYAVFVIYHLPSKVSFLKKKKVSVAYCWLCLKCKIIYVLTENLCFE